MTELKYMDTSYLANPIYRYSRVFLSFLFNHNKKMDILDKGKCSEVMLKIRAKNTRPEMVMLKALFVSGTRNGLNA